MNARAQRRQRGFTLVEAIAVIVITGLIGSFIAAFLKVPVSAYLNAVSRAEASDLADNTMRRLARDLRLALPNSVRVNGAGTYIEYIDTKVGLRYLAEDDVGIAPPAPYLSWNSAALMFTVVGGVPGGRHAPVVGDSVVVYNLGPDQEPGNAYDCTGVCNRAAITSLSSATITMGSNPFFAQAAAGTPLMSPGKRFHVVSSPVTYGCTGGRLIRYWNYGFQATQQVPPVGGLQAVLADNIASCAFTYTSLASQRSGMVGITLQFTPQDGSGPMILLHQISVDNTP